MSRNHQRFIEIHALRAASTLGVPSGAGIIHQDAAHEPSADREEMSTVVPLDVLNVDEPEIGFVDQRGGLQSVAATLVHQAALRDLAQLRINQDKDSLQSVAISAAPGSQQPGNFRRRGRTQFGPPFPGF